MKVHELHTILNDILLELKKDNPTFEFKSEATDTEASLLVIYPDGGESKFHVLITDKDEVKPQPVFYAVPEDSNNKTRINDKQLNDKWVAMLKESIKKTGFEYFYDELGGEG
jgi:hypothetical protein